MISNGILNAYELIKEMRINLKLLNKTMYVINY